MSRSKYWQHLLNQEGQPVPYATIQLYNAGTTTPVSAYSTENTATVISGGILTTDNSGYFEFWMDADLYVQGLKFDLLYSKPGSITSGGIYDIYVPINYEQVDEADTDTAKNKLVSNALAKEWEARPQIYTDLSVSSSEFTAVTAGAIETGYDYYYDINHTLHQGYPATTIYVSESKTINNISEYISNTVLRVWMETAVVSGSGLYNFILIG